VPTIAGCGVSTDVDVNVTFASSAQGTLAAPVRRWIVAAPAARHAPSESSAERAHTVARETMNG
jgi:hypothetical protein